MKFRPFVPLFLLFLSLPLFLVAFVFFSYDRLPPGTTLLGRNYSNLKFRQFSQRLTSDFPLPVSLSLTGDRDIVFSSAAVSAALDSVGLFHRLSFSLFHRPFFPAIVDYFSPKADQPLDILWDEDLLDQFIASLSSPSARPFVPTELSVVTSPGGKKTIFIKRGQLGQEIDRSSLRQSLLSRLRFRDLSPLSLPVRSLGNLPSAADLSRTEALAQKLLGKTVLLEEKNSSVSVTIDDQTLVSWLNFDGSLNSQKIIDYVANVAQSFDRAPVDAAFRFDNGRVLEFRPSVPGVSLRQLELISQIEPSISTLADSSENKLSLTVPIDSLEPTIKNGDANDLGLRQLLGQGVSTFKHSAAIRNFNIEKGASIVNLILVPPGETFSFLKSLGEVTLETGFKKAYVIRQGKTELDVGGGICQVSTTLFRAMLNAGVDIIERKNHAYRVRYYEEDMPPGYDATVFIPSPDLRFVNDTGHHLLIQNTYDSQNKKLTYEIYGTSDGRQVEITNYRKWDATPAPPDVYIDDPTLPPGKIIQDEQRIPGLKTAFDWKVLRGGEVLHQKTFQSNFVPWAAVFRRGPSIPQQ